MWIDQMLTSHDATSDVSDVMRRLCRRRHGGTLLACLVPLGHEGFYHDPIMLLYVSCKHTAVDRVRPAKPGGRFASGPDIR